MIYLYCKNDLFHTKYIVLQLKMRLCIAKKVHIIGLLIKPLFPLFFILIQGVFVWGWIDDFWGVRWEWSI